MHYVYVLLSRKDKKLYIGETSDVKKRLADHNQGRVTSTKNRRPLELIRLEEFASRAEALKRERYFKNPKGWRETNDLKKRFLGHRGVAQPG